MTVPVIGTATSADKEGQVESYNLGKGKWQAAFGYRGFRSHRHFVGSVEQNAENTAKGLADRDRSSTEVINHIHIPTVGVSYGVTDRLSLSADLPYLQAHRRSPVGGNGRPSYVTAASGISDLNLMGRYWLGDPGKHSTQNLSVGLGFKLPTGNDRADDEFLVRVDPNGQRITSRRSVDQSIQPGDGGFGVIAEVEAFKSFGRFTAFASGNYLSNPREQNDFLRDPTNLNPDPTSAYLSIADQYAARVGVATSLKRLGVSLGARLEGVPSSDLIGGDMGRRRPGYTVAVEPGVSYAWGRSAVSLSVPYLVRRVRTQNISDKLESERTGHYENGDAAFADYVVIVGFSRRF